MPEHWEGETRLNVDDEVEEPFRFLITVAGGKLTLWLEDGLSKRQWSTAEMEVNVFVTPGSLIPQATARDYALLCKECLGSEFGWGYCRVAYKKGDVIDLRLSVPFKFASVDTALEFEFSLRHIKVDLAAEVKRLESEVKRLRQELQRMRATVELVRPKHRKSPGQMAAWQANDLTPESFYDDDSDEIELLD